MDKITINKDQILTDFELPDEVIDMIVKLVCDMKIDADELPVALQRRHDLRSRLVKIVYTMILENEGMHEAEAWTYVHIILDEIHKAILAQKALT